MTLVRREDWRPQGVADLEPRAWEALRESERSVLVTAGAGAGKTEFLAQKATYLLQTGICPAPKRILAISFKRDAARNLASRVEKRCPPEQARRFNSLTFDAFAKSFVDRFRSAIPGPLCPPVNYRVVMPSRRDYNDFLDPPVNYRVVMPSRRDYNDFLDRHGFRGTDVSRLETAIARTRLPLEAAAGPLARVVSEYWRAQYNDSDEVLLSFPMINRLVDHLLRENSSIRQALHLTYPVVFLDEFQDTTFAQFELLHTAFDGSGAIFTAVGDDKQRIMVWAGAIPDAFARFEQEFGARRIALLSNWRSHEDLVRIQHAIASQIDPHVERPQARADREVDGDVAAVWQFASNEAEAANLASWIANEVRLKNVEPHDVAILARTYVNQVEESLMPGFARHGLRLRNEARMVGEISIQDLLGEDLTAICLALLRLGATKRSPDNWNEALRNMQFLQAVDLADDSALQQLQRRLQDFVRELRRTMNGLELLADSATIAGGMVLDFVGASRLRQAFPAYQRQQDFDRVWNGFLTLLGECAARSETWSEALDEFEGLGQIALMTIHKSKGLEFHTMIFYGLDNQTWWSLRPGNAEDLNTFFVAFTRAKQRAFFTLSGERGQPITWIERLLAPAGLRRVDSG